MLSKASVKARPSVLWCYKKELGFTSHRQKRMRKIKREIARGIRTQEEAAENPFELFVSATDIRYWSVGGLMNRNNVRMDVACALCAIRCAAQLRVVAHQPIARTLCPSVFVLIQLLQGDAQDSRSDVRHVRAAGTIP